MYLPDPGRLLCPRSTLSHFRDEGQVVIFYLRSTTTPGSQQDEEKFHDHEGKRRQSGAQIEEGDMSDIRRIATAFSQGRSNACGDLEPTETLPDPNQPNFDETRWLQSFINEFLEQGHAPKKVGISFTNLKVSGDGAALQLQSTVGSILSIPVRIGEHFSFNKKEPRVILHSFDGLLQPGELLIVLGRPESGCSTLLKTMCGELHGLHVDDSSVIHYDSIAQKQMTKEFKGEIAYNQEVDKHFPHLTVGQTLEFAAAARTPSYRIKGMSRDQYCKYFAQVAMDIFGISHTYNTKVGNDFVRGVSGGERKRVSLAEMMVAGVPFCAWDNSTRGLDSATALKFVQSLRIGADLASTAHAVAIYQASQAIYDLFDKTIVLYEGRQIYFGPANHAKTFFEQQGWICPQRQTVGDFLTSVTNPQERKTRAGMEDRVPRTPEDFEIYWRQSPEYQALQVQIDAHSQQHPISQEGEAVVRLREQKNHLQSKNTRKRSPYTISVAMQVKLNTKRAYQRIMGDMAATAMQVGSQVVLALIIGSVYYGTPAATAGFSSLGATLFMAVLLNALTAISEIGSLYNQRPIVQKHASYAFYHPATEAAAGVVSDIPIKFFTAVVFNIVLYFMSGLRRDPGPFFLYFLITFLMTFVMSAIFRTMAAVTSTISQAMTLAGVLVLAVIIYTGFVVVIPQMHPWFAWIRWVNPVFYAFEILIANEFHGREFTCSSIIPSYTPLQGDSWICSAVGSVAGRSTVNGDAYIATQYHYYYSHVWRNLGILFAFLIVFMLVYFIATELNSATSSVAEVLVFQRGHVPAYLQNASDQGAVTAEMSESEESEVKALEPQKDIFTWKDVVYDIEIKGEGRRLLDNVSGWVKPGTLTALMGVSGAGKTTLLDVLAHRTSMGVITGDMLVNGVPLDPSFQRKTGYVQQQDLHLQTATVRESLRFSAMLRQPASVSKEEKYRFVEDVIDMLSMRDFANAVVGIPGEGLNVEQRKLLTIGVELAAKPKLLLFLDEPTSGLDSQSSWSIVTFLRKLADSGQAVLCTVHQPSAILFQEFDRLLFLARGGKTVYFGNIGPNSRTLLDYLEKNGAPDCGNEENPAEYMLGIVNKGVNEGGQDWHSIWKSSGECREVEMEIQRICMAKQSEPASAATEDTTGFSEFAMPLSVQVQAVTYRIFQQYWRMPNYVLAKWGLGLVAGLFVGFTFYGTDGSQAGMSNVVYSVFMLTTIFSSLVQQIQPLFVSQRDLYEVRERPSKAYSWIAFLFANLIVEIPYQIITAILTYGSYYYAVVGVQTSDRQGLVLLFVIQLFIYAGSFAHLTITALPDAQTASGIVTLGMLMMTMFCGVLQAPQALPGFWVFMYRVNPFTYWISGIAGTLLHSRKVECSTSEMSIFNSPVGQTCGEYLSSYLESAPGYLLNPNATDSCQYCSIRNGDIFLAGANIFYSERWRNFGILWAFIIFNFFAAIVLYYVFRVKNWRGEGGKKSKPVPAAVEKVSGSEAPLQGK
ncbi:putative ABC multidrug transporter [Rhexocercosporidium sp. MPI-PUGE-AT-0058]|nr:putative ABC multidrug transporter [Rhexocercosporidium sp. MPI-PUGE-AT-0058]